MFDFKPLEHNILIVDDLPRNIQVVGNILSLEKLNIAYATNGESALELALNNSFDLVLLDIMMPGMDGFEVCRQLRENEKTRDLPVIFLTAKSDIDSMLKGFQLGAQDYVSKPFNSAELIARVRTHLDLREKKLQLDQLNQHLEILVAKRTRELEQANQRLSHLEKAKSDFLGIISHELRTPLNGIIGLTQLIAQTDINEEQRLYLNFLEQTSGRLSRFAETSLLITSLQAENLKVEYMQTSIKHLFSNAYEELKSLLDEKAIRVETQYENPDMLIDCDSELLRKSIVMILEECLFRLPNKHSILFASFTAKHQQILEFRDHGDGYDPLTLALFSQSNEGNYTHIIQNIGFSMIAVKLIMSAHNGTFDIENQADGGVLFRLTFKQNMDDQMDELRL